MSSMNPQIKELEAALAQAEADLDVALDLEPFIEQAAEILAKMDVDMPNGMGWLKTMRDTVTRKAVVVSALGRPRRLFRVLTGINKSISDAGRRAKNAPIQGISSEVGVVAGYNAYISCVEYSRRAAAKAVEHETNKVSKLTRLVHDATYLCTPYHLVLPQIQIGLWEATTGVAQYYEKHFEFKMLAPPEVELELCSREDKTYKWDWEIPNLGIIMRKSLQDQKDLGRLKGSVQSAMEQIFWCWVDKAEREYLFEKYPLLDVPYDDVKQQVHILLKQEHLI